MEHDPVPTAVPESCPCGSGDPGAHCCLPYVSGQQRALTALALMRSRYTAYVIKNSEYLGATWHASTRPEQLDVSGNTAQWTGLEIIKTSGGGAADTVGTVEFIAHYINTGRRQQLHEVSRFVQERGRWFYVDGVVREPSVKTRVSAGRNDPCPCGSGKKYKKCCM